VKKRVKINVQNITSNTLGRILRTKVTRLRLAQCYRRTFGSDLNNTSLVTFHGPAFKASFVRHYRVGGRIHPKSIWSSPMFKVGYFLTGDMSLNHPMWIQCETHFQDCFRFMSGVLLPHHGSLKSWNTNLLERIVRERLRSNYYVSVGVHNRFHPSPRVLADLLKAGQGIAQSNESQALVEEYFISPLLPWPKPSPFNT
jgi:hypothetical protein